MSACISLNHVCTWCPQMPKEGFQSSPYSRTISILNQWAISPPIFHSSNYCFYILKTPFTYTVYLVFLLLFPTSFLQSFFPNRSPISLQLHVLCLLCIMPWVPLVLPMYSGVYGYPLGMATCRWLPLPPSPSLCSHQWPLVPQLGWGIRSPSHLSAGIFNWFDLG